MAVVVAALLGAWVGESYKAPQDKYEPYIIWRTVQAGAPPGRLGAACLGSELGDELRCASRGQFAGSHQALL